MGLIVSSHQETSRYSCEILDMFLANTFLYVVKLTTRAQCSLTFSCKLSFLNTTGMTNLMISFLIVDFKHIFSSQFCAEFSSRSFHMALTEVIQNPHRICQLASVSACIFRMMTSHKRPLSTVHGILSLTNSALLTVNNLLHKKPIYS